jgi:cell division inhibitor SepF
MAGVWRKTMKYLGLVEDDEMDDVMDAAPQEMEAAAPAVRRATSRPSPVRGAAARRAPAEPVMAGQADEPEAIIRTIPQGRSPGGQIHRADPKRFNEAREIGERFKDGVPVIMNLQQTEEPIARRLVDFASGLVFAQDGKIEMVAGRVYLLTPRDVDVSAEERERLRDSGFYNQF